MNAKFPPITKVPAFLHGGDYNPDQWLHDPAVLEEDIRLMKKAACNTMTLGIFAWTALEPSDGQYEFAWLDAVMDRLAKNGLYAILATPSAAQPAWMSQKYPEVLRVDQAGGPRKPHADRLHYCLTSPVYRRKCAAMAEQLAQRYGKHPALIAWHLNNEYTGSCACELCLDAFRAWLGKKYGSLETLNRAWWTAFWSHTYTDWSQIAPVDPSCMGLGLDWNRFATDQTIDFALNEAHVLRTLSPGVPVTTNTYGQFVNFDWSKWAKHPDVIAWDNYPSYHDRADTIDTAIKVSFTADLYRSMKHRPFLLMESTPSSTNWMAVNKLKRPGVHLLSSLQAVAHGADSVQYFQWRKGRGGFEKFHGAVVDHVGHENTRVFKDVQDVGAALAKLGDVLGTMPPSQAAILFDKQNLWAIEGACGPHKDKAYLPTCYDHYEPFWRAGISADVIHEEDDFAPYRLIAAPMLYMVRPGVAKRLEEFVRAGGTLVCTYLSGQVDENDLVFTGGWPGPLRELLGVWAEEVDVLYDDEHNELLLPAGKLPGLTGRFAVGTYCERIHAESAKVLGTYGRDFYKGQPALTVNAFGKGKAYYLAARPVQTQAPRQAGQDFLGKFYSLLARQQKLQPALKAKLPAGVTAQVRQGDGQRFVFLLNFSNAPRRVNLGQEKFTDVLKGKKAPATLTLPAYGSAVLRS